MYTKSTIQKMCQFLEINVCMEKVWYISDITVLWEQIFVLANFTFYLKFSTAYFFYL